MQKLDPQKIAAVIHELENCLKDIDDMGLTRAGALLDSVLVEMRSIQRSIEAINGAGHPKN